MPKKIKMPKKYKIKSIPVKVRFELKSGDHSFGPERIMQNENKIKFVGNNPERLLRIKQLNLFGNPLYRYDKNLLQAKITKLVHEHFERIKQNGNNKPV